MERHLTGTFRNCVSANDFYKEFNLEDRNYTKFSFADMQEIFFLDRMDTWPKLLDQNDSMEFTFSLASFLPSVENFPILFDIVENFFHSMFQSEHNYERVKVAMVNMPTMALLMVTSTKEGVKQAEEMSKEGEV